MDSNLLVIVAVVVAILAVGAWLFYGKRRSDHLRSRFGAEYDRQLETICQEHYYPETNLLRQVEGVGVLTALTFVLTLEDPYRFAKSQTVGAYPGLVPARAQSGDRDPQRGISKEGDEMLRKLLVGSAHYIPSVPLAQIRI